MADWCVSMSPYPHPTRCARATLSRGGERFKPPCLSEVRAVFPSPIGRRCPEGADEGSVIVFPPFSHKPATPRPVRTSLPLPLSRRKRDSNLFLLPSGEGAPKGRMRVRHRFNPPSHCIALCSRTLTTAPLPEEEGFNPLRSRGKHRSASDSFSLREKGAKALLLLLRAAPPDESSETLVPLTPAPTFPSCNSHPARVAPTAGCRGTSRRCGRCRFRNRRRASSRVRVAVWMNRSRSGDRGRGGP